MAHRRIRQLLQANMPMESIQARTVINETIKGRLNNVSEFYLRHNGANTTLSDDLITTISMIKWSPRDAVAASYVTSMWYSSTENGRVIMNHVSTSTSTVLFDYCVIG